MVGPGLSYKCSQSQQDGVLSAFSPTITSSVNGTVIVEFEHQPILSESNNGGGVFISINGQSYNYVYDFILNGYDTTIVSSSSTILALRNSHKIIDSYNGIKMFGGASYNNLIRPPWRVSRFEVDLKEGDTLGIMLAIASNT